LSLRLFCLEHQRKTKKRSVVAIPVCKRIATDIVSNSEQIWIKDVFVYPLTLILKEAEAGPMVVLVEGCKFTFLFLYGLAKPVE
jgi:hypothetical protein